MPTLLVVADDPGAAATLRAVGARLERDPATRVHLVAPAGAPRPELGIDAALARAAAEARLDLALGALRRAGASADGEAGPADPGAALRGALDEEAFDEVVLVTTAQIDGDPAALAGLGVPVQRITGVATETRPVAVTLVVAERLAALDALAARLRAGQRRRLPALLVVVPQDGGPGRGAGAARARLGNALDRVRGAGLIAAGHLGDPDPHLAVVQALALHPVDEVVIATLPATRSAWLRAGLVERVRRATAAPVEHLVA
jgi:hypothetical protein